MDETMQVIHRYIMSRDDDLKEEVGLDDDLFASGILDSMGLLGLVSHLEDVYQTNIDLSEIDIDKISTIRKISLELVPTTSAEQRMKIIDGHCHLASTRYIPQQFFEDVAANITCKMIAYGEKVSYSKILQMLLMQHNDHYGDRLIVEMDAASISRTVLLIPDFSSAMAMPLPQREIYEAHFQVTQKYPGRFYVFPGVNPLRGQVALDEFVESIENFGFHGLKLYPPCGYSPSDKCLYPFYDFCQEKSLPVLLHTGPTVQSLNLTLMPPSLICAAARDFPGVNFILAHGAVAYVEEAVELARNWPNLYIDTGGISGAIFPGKWQKQLLSVLLADIENKVIFGSDWPVTRMSGGLKNLVTGITSNPAITQQITPTALQVFFGENITRLIEGG